VGGGERGMCMGGGFISILKSQSELKTIRTFNNVFLI
jgi:hypothetical protein